MNNKNSAWRVAGILSVSLMLAACLTSRQPTALSLAPDLPLNAPPAYAKPWAATAGLAGLPPAASQPRATALAGNALVEPHRVYNLADLVDLGLRANPATRHAWGQARAAAAGLGIAESAWLPVLTAKASYQYVQNDFPTATRVFLYRGSTIVSGMELSWALFDLKRPAQIDQSTQQLLAANLQFNRAHQQVTYDIQRRFYAYNAALAQVSAAATTVRQTQKNAESVQARLAQGLATRPEWLLAAEDRAKSEYELQTARGRVSNGLAELAESLGITPNQGLQTVALDAMPLPADIEASADSLIDGALSERPDLSARLAEIRAKEAEIRKAEAAFWPKVSLSARGGYNVLDYQPIFGPATPGNPLPSNVASGYPVFGAGLAFEWNLFEGFASGYAVEQAKAKRDAAQAEFDTLQLTIIKDVWKAYADFKTALRKRDYAVAMLQAAEQSYAAQQESYLNGLSTVIELLTAERSLANARYTDIESRAGLLQSLAALVFAAGSEGKPIAQAE